ncbi:hypothetical protein INR49_019190 [Caranx melampygus]|nr:hypothetical protein INR49_019190 [Caranx melampygus]
MGSVVLITEGLVQHHNHYNVLHTVPNLPASGGVFLRSVSPSPGGVRTPYQILTQGGCFRETLCKE